MSCCRKLGYLSVAAAALWAVPACGGDDDDGDGGGDVDAGGGVDASADCPTADTLGPFDPLPNAQAFHLAQDDADPAVRFLSVGAVVEGDEPPVDFLFIELWDGFGAFAGGQLAAGEFTIEGEEAALATCGVCVRIFGNATMVGNQIEVEKEYIATAGTVTVDSVGTREGNAITGNYTGTATGLVLSEIDTESQNGGPLAGGCETTIDSVTWDVAIVDGT
jgi:hypothetical protein